ncbi:MAG: zinc-ribbon domain-containing protein [Promethearchaeota archaeon]
MPRTAREHALSFILVGITIATGILLMPLFGPKPLENPIAVVILLVVFALSACFLFNYRFIRLIAGEKKAFKEKSQIQQQQIDSYLNRTLQAETIACQNCGTSNNININFCTKCGSKLIK